MSKQSNHHIKRNVFGYTLVFGAVMSVHAQQNFNTVAPLFDDEVRQYLSFGALVGTRWRDNADLSSDNINAEREDRIGGNFAAFKRWQGVELSTDYTAEYLFIDSESPTPQTDRSEIRGITQLNLEPLRDRLDIEMSHSRQNLLGRFDQLNIRNNFVARDTVSVQPNVQIMNSRKSQLSVSGLYSQVWFDEQNSTLDTIDSRLSGIQGRWVYAIDSVSGFELQANDSTLTYQPSSGLEEDYDYRSVEASYFSNLRNLKYRISGGVNSFRGSDGDVFSSPLFSAEISYTQGLTTWRGSSSLLLTDTSRGNQVNRSSGLTVGDGRADFIDQYRLFSNLLEVETVPCRRCNLDLSISSAYEVYNQDATQDNYSLGFRGFFRYDLNQRWMLGSLLTLRGQAFDEDNPAPNFTTTNIGFITRYQLTDSFVVEGLFQHSIRRTGLSNNRDEYDLNEASLTMMYQLR